MNNCSLIFENENEASAVSFHENCLQNYTAYNIVQEQRYDSLYEVPVEIIILLSIFYGTISIVAVVGNFLVIWIVTTSRRMQNVTNCFIANLALADIVIGIFAIPFQFQAALLQRWHLPHFMCPFCPFVQVLSVSVSILTLTAIAIDRHKAILNPLRAYPSKFRAKVAIAGIWIVSFFIALPMALALRVDYIEYYDSSGRIRVKPFCYNTQFPENLMLWYRIIILLIQYIVPLCIISCVYSRMALRLWGSQAPGNAQCIRDATLMKNKKKVIKMLVIVVALFAFCWLPLQTYTVLQDIFPEINSYRYINIIFFCCDWLAMSNSCYNPFIYGIYNEKFKREFKQRFPFNKSHKWSTQSVLESTEAEKSFQPGRPSVRSSTTTVYYWKNNYSIRTTGRSIQSSNGGNYLVPPSCRTNGGGATKHRNSAVSRENSLRSEKEETYAVILKSNSQVTVGCCLSDIELEEHCL